LTVSYTTSVAVGASGTLVNAAVLTALGGDPRTPLDDAATPLAGASSQGSDKLSAKAASSVTGGTLSVAKSLSGVSRGGNAVSLSGYQVRSGDVLTYTVSVTETSNNAAAATTLTETVPANTSYSLTTEGWTAGSGIYTQDVTVSAGATVSKTFTVTVGTLSDGVTAITNTVSSSAGTCTACTVSTPVAPQLVTLSQSEEKTIKKGAGYTTAPIADCQNLATSILATPAHGTATSSTPGLVTYTPEAGYSGRDTFRYDVQCAANLIVEVTTDVLVIDPSGVVYDAVTRVPVSGATVTLIAPSGSPLPDSFLDLTIGGPNGQVTGTDGRYALLLKTNAPTGTYLLRVVAPAGYQDAPASSIPPKASLYTPGLGGGVDFIQPQETAPTLAQDTTYYLAFAFRLGSTRAAELSNGVAQNHVPLDPVKPPLPLVVTKVAAKRTVGPGDLVPYRITVRTQDGVPRALTTVVDIMPAGLRYVAGSGVVNGRQAEPQVNGGTLSWAGQLIPAKGLMTYDLVLSVGAGVTQGNRTNVALARGVDGSQISNRAEAAVAIGPDKLFDCTDVIGKVFDDANGNGRQDAGESGIANVRLATVNGLLISTDADGRYHIACAALPNALIGSNFVLKLDPASLPDGYAVAGENPASVRLTNGLMHRVDFAAARRGHIAALSAADFDAAGVLRPARAEALVRQARDAAALHQSVRFKYASPDAEDAVLVQRKLDAAEAAIRREVPTIGTIDRDIITATGTETRQ
jgi:uncharacterized repeat protein (TIGR01451 family)